MGQTNPLMQLATLGQSVWLDYIDRQLLHSGRLDSWITKGLRGLTSNPSIFHKAITSGQDYDADIKTNHQAGLSMDDIYDRLSMADIQAAADAFRVVYDGTKGLDGYVSLEVNPRLADDAESQIAEGRRLFKAVDRPNLMIKVPATSAGYKVIETLIFDGIPVNMTLIFSRDHYQQTSQAYMRGLEKRLTMGLSLDIRSVASVFISRIDAQVDPKLETVLGNNPERDMLMGTAAVDNARMIYEDFLSMIQAPRFMDLAEHGAHPQRVLWASTSTKNPQYRDVKYVEELIAPDTVNTIPEPTLDAVMKQQVMKTAFTDDYLSATTRLNRLKELGVDVDHICEELQKAGIDAFVDSFGQLMAGIEDKLQALIK